MSLATELIERNPSFKERFEAFRDEYTQGKFGGRIGGGTLVRGVGFYQTVYLNSHEQSEALVRLVNDDGSKDKLTFLSPHSPNDILQLRYQGRLVWRAPASTPPPGLGLICEWPRKTNPEVDSEG